MITYWAEQKIIRRWDGHGIPKESLIEIIEEEIPDLHITQGETVGQLIARAQHHVGWGDVVARLCGLPRSWDTSTIPILAFREDVTLAITGIDVDDNV